jgi:hypothetical protein
MATPPLRSEDSDRLHFAARTCVMSTCEAIALATRSLSPDNITVLAIPMLRSVLGFRWVRQ